MALEIFYYALDCVRPDRLIRSQISFHNNLLTGPAFDYDVKQFRNIFLIGVGKASAAMAVPLEDMLGHAITDGVIIVKYGHGKPLRRIRVIEAGHPVVDESGIRGTKEIMELLQTATGHDLVICLISGGGSALLENYADGINLQDGQQLNQLLLSSGAAIHEINAVRKHVSTVKGGQLARHIAPAAGLTFILSDVIGDPLDVIASGPTVPDNSTFQEAEAVLKKYRLLETVPGPIQTHILKGSKGEIRETPRSGDACFGNMRDLLIANNRTALDAAVEKARFLGLNPCVLSSGIEGESRDVARVFASIVRSIDRSDFPVRKPACLIAGGETTVRVTGKGTGGRNQEFALSAAVEIAHRDNITILSAGTDGTDGPTDATGAVVDGRTVSRGLEIGLNPETYLRNNDSYNYFAPLNDLIMTGPTMTNVMDIMIGIAI